MTSPVVAPEGAVAVIEVALQEVTEATVPLNQTVFDPCVLPNSDPVIVTDDPGSPAVGKRLVRGSAT